MSQVKISAYVAERTKEVNKLLQLPSIDSRYPRLLVLLENDVLELKLRRNGLVKEMVSFKVKTYRGFRYESDIAMGHQEATTMATEKISGKQATLADVEAYIGYLQGLISIMKGYEASQRRN